MTTNPLQVNADQGTTIVINVAPRGAERKTIHRDEHNEITEIISEPINAALEYDPPPRKGGTVFFALSAREYADEARCVACGRRRATFRCADDPSEKICRPCMAGLALTLIGPNGEVLET